jgi:predicted aldo/keto reductase-like oxidoreductase
MDGVPMKYRRFGNLDWKVSALGFGAMRLPTTKEDQSKIDETEAIKMIRYAIDHGVNYIDTAYPYHLGTSEILVGKALQDGYREKVKLATKMPTWTINNQQDMDKFLEEQLRKLNTQIDFYLLHGLNRDRWAKLKPLDVTGWAEKKINEGKFKHLGFSFHDSYDIFKDIIDSYEGWTLCQIQYNYMDQDCQAGTRGLKYAASKGLAVVVMEPVAGGRLAMRLAKPIAETFDKARIKRTQAEWALLWVLNHAEVSLALSGMSTMQQVQENVKTAEKSEPNMLSKKELQLLNQVAQKYREHGFIDCSGCRYCQPCPEGVDIPAIFALFNKYYAENMSEEVKAEYLQKISKECRAARCKSCARCEELCPQHLPTRKLLSNAAYLFEQIVVRP